MKQMTPLPKALLGLFGCYLFVLLCFLPSCKESKEAALHNVIVREGDACHARFQGLSSPGNVAWRGGDNAQSVRLSPDRLIWVFSDTFVGRRKGKARHESTLINNTIAIQQGSSCRSPVSFHWRTKQDGTPDAFFRPAGGKGFFWPFSLYLRGSTLLVMLQWYQKNPKPKNIFDGAIPLGVVLAVIRNPQDPPEAWQSSQQILSQGSKPFVHHGLRLFERASAPGYLFVLGSEEKGFGDTDISLHRFRFDDKAMKAGSLETLQPDDTWSATPSAPRKILFQGASQTSIHWDGVAKRFVGIYAKGWDGIFLRTSESLTAGWSAPTLFFKYPELQRDKHTFCGTLGVHLGFQDAPLAVTYVCNSTKFFDVVGDMNLYVPRFLMLKWSLATTP